MSKSLQQQASLLLKNVELQNALHEYSQEIDAEYLTEAQQAAIKAVAAYKRRQDGIAYMYPLAEIVYDFFGERDYQEEFFDYKAAAVQTLVALADPKINQALKEKRVGTQNLANIMGRLVSFIDNLQCSSIEPLLVIIDVLHNKHCEERILAIKDEYEERLRVSLAGKHYLA